LYFEDNRARRSLIAGPLFFDGNREPEPFTAWLISDPALPRRCGKARSPTGGAGQRAGLFKLHVIRCGWAEFREITSLRSVAAAKGPTGKKLHGPDAVHNFFRERRGSKPPTRWQTACAGRSEVRTEGKGHRGPAWNNAWHSATGGIPLGKVGAGFFKPHGGLTGPFGNEANLAFGLAMAGIYLRRAELLT